MNVTAIALLVFALTQSDTAALVDAAKDAKAKRKASTRKVITNADVAKSKGKVIQRKPEDLAPLPPLESLLEKQAAERKAREALQLELEAADGIIAVLTKELALIEQSYYEANDLDYRDKVLAAKFEETRVKLDEARAKREKLAGGGGAAAASAAEPVPEPEGESRRPYQPPLHQP